jgi:hypothetical protein
MYSYRISRKYIHHDSYHISRRRSSHLHNHDKTNVSSTEEMVQGEQNQNIWSIEGQENGATGVHRAFSYGNRGVHSIPQQDFPLG